MSLRSKVLVSLALLAAARAQQVQAQKRDADSRKVVWDAENGLGNPEGESGKADGQ